MERAARVRWPLMTGVVMGRHKRGIRGVGSGMVENKAEFYQL